MNHFIVADSSRCIGCRTCEVACVVSHEDNQDCSGVTPSTFTARIRVVKTGAFSTAVTCHHCEDAPCANVCPVGAIRRSEGAIHVEQSRCIGCKSCMIACPFGAMQVTGAQALKCDLCQHRETGPACVEACPTSALSCINPLLLREARLRSLSL
ncbi:4Fe-4S dicluster domain-containing protein [Kosakonia sp.]|uniref:4Fe-4S dicluster domain-containing protein n=1 Tax=Kosakonia sp. TaxID=1916651 RepID=UPI00289F9D28|nr:4Fe-4S dicluster domain-containing protein [Kosakonia sp.]